MACPSLSSMPRTKWEGWLILDRVMDAPVYQAELTRNRYDQASPKKLLHRFSGPVKSRAHLVLAMEKNVDCLLIAKPAALNTT